MIAGVLKQQCLDESGLYDWVRKPFRLDLERCLWESSNEEVDDATEQQWTILQLEGAKYAKEWSVSSATAGYGFDVVWNSGKIWSFLAENELACLQWVNGLNECIQRLGEGKGNAIIPADVGTEKIRQRFASFTAATTVEPVLDHNSSMEPPAGREERGDAGPKPSYFEPPFVSARRDISDIHEELSVPDKNTEGQTEVNHDRGWQLSKIISQEAEDFEVLRQRYEQLYRQHDRTTLECQRMSNQMKKLTLQLEEAESAVETERRISSENQRHHQMALRESENKLLRVSAEGSSLYDSMLQAGKEQHSRELQCLKEELTTERKRYSKLLNEESELRHRAEGQLVDLRQEIANLQNLLHQVKSDLAVAQDNHQAAAIGWSQEKSLLTTKYESAIARLDSEKAALVNKQQSEIRRQLDQTQGKYESSLREMEATIRETVQKELNGEHLRKLMEMQKKCTLDVESARKEAKLSVHVEVERVREVFLERERQTAQDLTQLEKLHKDRLMKLEKRLSEAVAEGSRWEERFVKLESDSNDQLVDQNHLISEHHAQLEELTGQLKELQRKLEQSQRNCQEAAIRESSFRQQYAKAIEEARLSRAELLLAKQKLSEGAAEAFHYRQAASEKDYAQALQHTSMEIANGEIKMLELEVTRMKTENEQLREELGRMDKIIYGSSAGGKRAAEVSHGRISSSTPRSPLRPSYNTAQTYDTPFSGGPPLGRQDLTFDGSFVGRGNAITQQIAKSHRKSQFKPVTGQTSTCRRSPTTCWAAAAAAAAAVDVAAPRANSMRSRSASTTTNSRRKTPGRGGRELFSEDETENSSFLANSNRRQSFMPTYAFEVKQ